MNNVINQIKEHRAKIDKLEKDFKRGIPPFQGFTIDISYGGNKQPDIARVCVGSISDDEKTSELFYKMVLNSLKNSLKFWEDQAARELSELTLLLTTKKD